MEPSTQREWVDPTPYLQRFSKQFGLPIDHITVDPDLHRGNTQYAIRRGSTHDGTLLFTEELIGDVLLPLVLRRSCMKTQEQITAPMNYRIGWMRRACVYGMVDIPAGRYPGQRERIAVPVISTPVS